MNEETGKWVVLSFFPYEPMQVYGLFDSFEQAQTYAEQQGMAKGDGAYSIQMVLNAHYTEDAADYVGMGWS